MIPIVLKIQKNFRESRKKKQIRAKKENELRNRFINSRNKHKAKMSDYSETKSPKF
jgi:hypothetical protein